MTKENTLDPTEQALRDMFAMGALGGVISTLIDWDDCDTTFKDVAVNAYSIADAMMEERKK